MTHKIIHVLISLHLSYNSCGYVGGYIVIYFSLVSYGWKH